MRLKYKTALLVLFFLTSLGAQKYQTQTDQPLHVFVLAGQSNMSGAADAPQIQETSANIKKWDGEWITALEPLQSSGSAGPGLSFAVSLLKLNTASYKIGLVPCAVSGSKIEQWQRNDAIYQNCVTKTLAALATQQATLSGVLFAQGEANTYTKISAEGWASLALQFARDFRTDTGKLEVPFIYAQLGPDPNDDQHPYWSYLRSLQPSLVDPSRAYIRMVRTSDLQSVAQHFDLNGYDILGKRFAAVYYANFGQ